MECARAAARRRARARAASVGRHFSTKRVAATRGCAPRSPRCSRRASWATRILADPAAIAYAPLLAETTREPAVAARRTISHRARDRSRRDGHRLSRRRSEARASGRGEDAARRGRALIGRERFAREIEIAARLSHPHILPLHDSGEVTSERQRRAVVSLLRLAVRRRRIAARSAAARAAACRRGRRAAWARDRAGARLRASPRRRPPRHQAGEHPAARRARGHRGLRHRARDVERGRRRRSRDRRRSSARRRT